eukprot:COSAG02_NODE_1847_length_10681_cov_21.865904_6_plen_86_part_00
MSSDNQPQAGSEFNTPRIENKTNFRIDAQEKAATRGGQRGRTAVVSEFSLLPTNPTHPLIIMRDCTRAPNFLPFQSSCTLISFVL